jgi:hypothetical protein
LNISKYFLAITGLFFFGFGSALADNPFGDDTFWQQFSAPEAFRAIPLNRHTPPAPFSKNYPGFTRSIIHFPVSGSQPVITETQQKLLIEAAGKAKWVGIRGYSDSTGPQRVNTILSRNRASRVKAFLMAHGISEQKISCTGRDEEFITTNSTAQGRQANRRVEIDLADYRFP